MMRPLDLPGTPHCFLSPVHKLSLNRSNGVCQNVAARKKLAGCVIMIPRGIERGTLFLLKLLLIVYHVYCAKTVSDIN